MRILALTWLLLISSFGSAEIVIVVSKDAEINELSEQSVANIFLAKTHSYPNGQKVVPIELKNNPNKANFYASISGKSANQLNAYWTTLVFTGKGKPPRTVRNTELLISQLQQVQGAIAYVQENQVTDDMKVIHRIE